ncbi:MAG: D-alanine--D-alanine ligase [Gammaproteobacteria bacterium]|nr:D-alanine--D-alanine ligase [Gammaproteobacteria bacterium]
MKKLRIGVIFGGRSGEHEISLLSAKEVIAAMDPNKYEVIPIGISKRGEWLLTSPENLHSLNQTHALVSLLPDPSHQALLPVSGTSIQCAHDTHQLDVIFPLIHGTYGEDGCIQGLLELANLPYVGAGVLGSALGMDKVLMKTVFKQAGLPITDFQWTTRKQWQRDPIGVQKNIETNLNYPVFVKPANLGSSVGISKVKSAATLPAAMNLAAKYDRKIIIEAAVPHARDIEISVLGNAEPRVSVPGEIISCREFYDYTAKYLEESQLQIPANLPTALVEQIGNMAKTAFCVIGCEGLARIDFLINAKTSDVFVSEINTLPGFTRVSMYPKMWEQTGLSYAALIDTLIQLALERHQEIQENVTSFEIPA